ncbi:NAD(P)/FAD-dependent oxidoreductase [Candidatus Bathyarchaeota archaeon]|nr:NAD(P)/FAD-dependent oxidoreductase [Candidatus Bathyarchaeota archaeon]
MIAILGGGWAGVIASLEIKLMNQNSSIIIIDKSNYCERGGLLRSEFTKGFVFDVHGSHVIFSRNNDVLSRILALLKENVVKHIRRSFILLDDTFIPYPFENGLYALDAKNRAEAIVSFLESLMSRQNDWVPKTFRDWIYGFNGKWIAEKYLIPYNEKIWKRSLDQIDADWVYIPGRLPIADWREVVKSAVGIPTIGYIEQSTFYYPENGGIQALYDSALNKAIQSGVKVIWNETVVKVKKVNNKWIINDKYQSDTLINTLPLPIFTRIIDAPETVIKAADSLDYNNILVIGVGLNKPAPDQHWVYVPQKDVIFHRYAWISNYSPYNAPNRKSSIIAEITVPKMKQVNLESIKERVIEDFIRLGVFKREDILFAKAWFYEYGYPIYTIGHRKDREEIFNWLNQQRIYSVGRWGSWQYWNIDKVYEAMLEVINEISDKKWMATIELLSSF